MALVLVTGLQWAALQTVAWTMLASNLRCGSFSQAVSKTFDGRHPCCLCKAIAAARKSEKKSAVASVNLKMDFLLSPRLVPRLALGRSEVVRLVDTSAPFLSCEPPVPPPRAV